MRGDVAVFFAAGSGVDGLMLARKTGWRDRTQYVLLHYSIQFLGRPLGGSTDSISLLFEKISGMVVNLALLGDPCACLAIILRHQIHPQRDL